MRIRKTAAQFGVLVALFAIAANAQTLIRPPLQFNSTKNSILLTYPDGSTQEIDNFPLGVMRGNGTTSQTGAWMLTFNPPFVNPPFINISPIVGAGATQPVICPVQTEDVNGAVGFCKQTIVTTLSGLLTGILGAVINPTGNLSAAVTFKYAAAETNVP